MSLLSVPGVNMGRVDIVTAMNILIKHSSESAIRNVLSMDAVNLGDGRGEVLQKMAM